MKSELQAFLDSIYGQSKQDILIPYTIGAGAQGYIRFELGGENQTSTLKRIEQATSRSFDIFNETFNSEKDIWVLAYEYIDNNFLDEDTLYLYKQFNKESNIYNTIEKIASYSFTKDNDGNSIPELTTARVFIVKHPIDHIDIRNILSGKANIEMGISPGIIQDVYFISPTTGVIFNMYDDRGCDLYAPDKEIIRHIYNNKNEWILDYNREDIDKIFK